VELAISPQSHKDRRLESAHSGNEVVALDLIILAGGGWGGLLFKKKSMGVNRHRRYARKTHKQNQGRRESAPGEGEEGGFFKKKHFSIQKNRFAAYH